MARNMLERTHEDTLMKESDIEWCPS